MTPLKLLRHFFLFFFLLLLFSKCLFIATSSAYCWIHTHLWTFINFIRRYTVRLDVQKYYVKWWSGYMRHCCWFTCVSLRPRVKGFLVNTQHGLVRVRDGVFWLGYIYYYTRWNYSERRLHDRQSERSIMSAVELHVDSTRHSHSPALTSSSSLSAQCLCVPIQKSHDFSFLFFEMWKVAREKEREDAHNWQVE
jgi:hypothetical protein